MNLKKLATIAYFLMPFLAYATDIDDAINYKPSTQVASNAIQAFSIQDIIHILPTALDDKGVYHGDESSATYITYTSFWKDPRAKAFDKENFEECEAFYLHGFGSAAKGGFESILRFSFPENEERKINASKAIRYSLDYLEKNGTLGAKCANREKYTAVVKAIFNTIIQAAPEIIKEKQRSVEIAAQKRTQVQLEENFAQSKIQAEAKAKADGIVAESKSNDERNRKTEICQNSNEYKLYQSSAIIESNNVIVENAKLTIQRQEEGAKISGVFDKRVMYEMGNKIIEGNRLNTENFEIYKKIGGTAKRKELVRKLSNPCISR
jgi:hypothetical protein